MDKKVITWSRSRKGSLNKSSMTVKLALNTEKFESVSEWVKAFRQLEKLLEEATPQEKLAIISLKFERLEKLFSHLYPKIKETEQETQILLEVQETATGTAIEDQPTEVLIEAVSNESDTDKT